MTKITTFLIFALSLVEAFGKDVSLLNVSYDPTRELYEAYNPAFTKYWQEKSEI